MGIINSFLTCEARGWEGGGAGRGDARVVCGGLEEGWNITVKS